MIVPDHLISSCVDITHRALGHPGFHRMWNTIRKSYFWKSIQTVTVIIVGHENLVQNVDLFL